MTRLALGNSAQPNKELTKPSIMERRSLTPVFGRRWRAGTMTPAEILTAGAHLLEPIVVPHGFVFDLQNEGLSSGGPFASGVFRRANRSLELHFRYSLGFVSYRVGALMISHTDYARAVRATGVLEPSSYPGFSRDPLDGFRHLALDLARFGRTFLSGREFGRLAQWVAQNARRRGIGAT
jgi:hypothetical protein